MVSVNIGIDLLNEASSNILLRRPHFINLYKNNEFPTNIRLITTLYDRTEYATGNCGKTWFQQY